ncbi:hypothetical protein [Parasitella parasitica]|uniref:Uncharacterized protein n=1 Tax=Parasitella parasitica TaxID=35722 RepID=A0A0B7MTE4_9FUNG|nr:hypothetical protein [Parasitella parasitica]
MGLGRLTVDLNDAIDYVCNQYAFALFHMQNRQLVVYWKVRGSLQVLDILDLFAKRCLSKPHSAASELAAYRKIAKILDEILDGTMRDMLDGESICKASESIAKVHEKLYGSTISLYSGFGRRIDLIIYTKERELSTSEWKRGQTSTLECLQQQCKNIRMNKAIPANILQLPLDEPDRDAAFTVDMDWVGNKGYMLAVKRVQDVYVAKPLSVLLMPQYVYEIPSFNDTLNYLYAELPLRLEKSSFGPQEDHAAYVSKMRARRIFHFSSLDL